jgi:ribosomal protein S1
MHAQKKQRQEALAQEDYNWSELKVGSVRERSTKLSVRSQSHLHNSVGQIKQVISGSVKYLVDGAARIELSGGIAGVLPNCHLSDHVGHCEAIRATLSKGSQFKEMVVWSKNDALKRITLSCKPSLIEAAKAGQFVLAKEDLKSGMIVSVRAPTPRM